MRRNLLSILLALAGLLPVNAQYTFTFNVSWSGNCSGYTAQMNQAIRGFQTQTINGFPTRELCEQTRAMCHQELGHIELVYYDVRTGKEIKREATNCKLNVTTSPCTGRPMAGTVGTLNALGVSQGTSFYSANSANEIQNWSSDDMERMLALDKSFNSFEPTNVSTRDVNFDNARNNSLPTIDPDKLFVPINMRDEQGNITQPNEYYFGEVMSPNDERLNYFLEKEFTDELHSEYFQEKKINIEDLLLKDNKTQFELDLIRDYEIWRDNKLTESELYKNLAICSAMTYVDADKSMLTNNSDFRFLSKDHTPESQQVLRALQLIESCNNDNQNEGFHADMFYNEKTNEYVVSFRGTEATWEDIKTDIEQGAGVVPTQYRMAIEIGEVIRQIVSDNPDIKISITGHSLGGGLATISGVVSGQPTVVFNPAGVHKNTFEYAGVSDKVAEGNYNIVRISDTHDILTNAQENTAFSPVRESARALLFSAAKYKTKDDIISANYASAALPSATGQLKVIDSGHNGMLAPIDGHRIVPMAEKLIATHETFKNSMKSDDNLRQFRVYISE
ncbi:MAG: DUF2974 domain-containing protein [Prevotella sp.]|nr:DUF2974 domain-containing protein [Prevotella sp.]